ncbi:MAG: hypothetical protein ACERKZ_10280 [Lachnotalea sp.]
MENNRIQQEDALRAVIEYNKKLVPALEEVMIELKGNYKEDTTKYLTYILKGVNWVIEVVNGTRSLLDENKEVVKKDEVNQIIITLNQAVKDENNVEIANIIECGILPFILNITDAANDILSSEE